MQRVSNYFKCGHFIIREKYRQNLLINSFTRKLANLLHSCMAFLLVYAKYLLSYPKIKYKYTVCVCTMFKNEAQYLNEWINYHLLIGVDHFYMYNNNSEDDFQNVLQSYIDQGIVDLIEWPQSHSQMLGYQDCYEKHRKDTQWLTFIDIDEFICPISTDNVKEWLKPYKCYPGIAIYWKQFGSNGRLVHDTKQLVIEQYTQCWPKPSTFTKMICNMDFDFHNFQSPHIIKASIMNISIPPINQYGKFISFGIHRLSFFYPQNTIQINHYWGKAFDSFKRNKIDGTDVYHDNDLQMGQIRKQLLQSHEAMCTTRDYVIQKFLLYTKLRMLL